MTKLAKSAIAAAVLGVTALQATVGHAYNRSFYIVNESGRTIVAVRASHVDRETFGFDLLGRYVVRAGYQIGIQPFNHQGYCRFDIQVTFDDGSRQNIMNVNLCEATKVVTYGFTQNAFYHQIVYG